MLTHPTFANHKFAGYSTVTFTNPAKCKHDTGWYVNVKFWIFTKRIFVCCKCGTYKET